MNFAIAANSRILPLPYRGARLELRQQTIRCPPGNAQHRIYGLGNYLIRSANSQSCASRQSSTRNRAGLPPGEELGDAWVLVSFNTNRQKLKYHVRSLAWRNLGRRSQPLPDFGQELSPACRVAPFLACRKPRLCLALRDDVGDKVIEQALHAGAGGPRRPQQCLVPGIITSIRNGFHFILQFSDVALGSPHAAMQISAHPGQSRACCG